MMFSVDSMVKIDDSVVRSYSHKIIENFEKRGWACYEVGDRSTTFLSESDIENCVKINGREKSNLKVDVIYSLLPLVYNSFYWKDVKDAMSRCIALKRYPFYIDLESYEEDGKEYVEPLGVYLIDSILFNSIDNTLELIVDYDLMLQLDIMFEERPGNVIIDMMYADKILKQIIKQVR